MENYTDTISFIKSLYPNKDFIPLHEPLFIGNERKYVMDAIDSTFVSSVGEYVNRFEKMMAEVAGTKYAIATVNGTAALHISLILADVKQDDEVITQALTFIATANAISYIGAKPVFIDVDKETLGMSPNNLKNFLNEFGERKKDGFTYNKLTGKRIKACVPMHTFGFPCKIDELVEICNLWNIKLIEDAAESIGSYYKGKHTGSFGLIGTFSFNGNKTITCGGGGSLVTNNESIAKLAKHLTTQAKVPHSWEFNHDHIGYNYRMPNLNAAMACAQLEQLPSFLINKRELANKYHNFFSNKSEIEFINEPKESSSNYWLNCILLNDINKKEMFLEMTNKNGVMTRPVWKLMNKLPMFSKCQNGGLSISESIENRLVNLPSSVQH